MISVESVSKDLCFSLPIYKKRPASVLMNLGRVLLLASDEAS